ncbi:hypothetical protein O3P69_020958 [Scylla paramamosain]|uniref:Uncharacterized protein n=1 Tax=Scylla paramamosain TaxID=85552 RepID=A0AAW0SIJ5_SCYPA
MSGQDCLAWVTYDAVVVTVVVIVGATVTLHFKGTSTATITTTITATTITTTTTKKSVPMRSFLPRGVSSRELRRGESSGGLHNSSPTAIAA